MSVSLQNSNGDICLSWAAWGDVLELACMFGWEPAGTEPIGWLADDGREFFCPELASMWDNARTAQDKALVERLDKSECEADSPSSYFGNLAYRVTDDDARNLGDALELALSDVPRHDCLAHLITPGRGISSDSFEEYDRASCIERLSGNGRQGVRAVIAHCRVGGFDLI